MPRKTPDQSRANQSGITAAPSSPRRPAQARLPEVKGSGKQTTVAAQAAATKDLLQAVRERKKQESDPLFIATQLYGETRKSAAPRSPGKKSPEERAALRQQLYTAVQAQEEARLAREEEEAGDAMRKELLARVQIGRPTDWHPELGHSLCAWVSQGNSVRAWCRQTGISLNAVFSWMEREPGFKERYDLAREGYGVEALVDDILRLPDEAADRPISMPQAKVLELQIDVRKWLASKLMPKRYGDTKQDNTAQGVINISIGIPQRPAVTVVEEVQPTAVQVSR